MMSEPSSLSPAPPPEPVARRRGPALELGLVLLAFVAVSTFSWRFQKRIDAHGGRGWDGTFYCVMAECFVRHVPVEAHKPFVFRVGEAYLAARLSPRDVLRGFFIVNLLCALSTVVLLQLWFRGSIASLGWRLAMNLLFQLHWLGPVRFNWYYPALTDPAVYPFLLGGLLLLRHPRALPGAPLFYAALTAAGVAFREVMLLLPLLALVPPSLRRWPTRREIVTALTFALPAAVAGALVTWRIHASVHALGGFDFYRTARGLLLGRRPVEVLIGWLDTFGPLVFLLLLRATVVWRVVRDDARVLALLLAIVGLTWVGGTDIERFAIWGAPAVLLLVGAVGERDAARFAPFKYAALGLTLLAFRALVVIPRASKGPCYGLQEALSMWGTCPTFHELSYPHASPEVQAAWRHLHLCTGAALLLIFVLCLVVSRATTPRDRPAS
jgi:hypothetical protein